MSMKNFAAFFILAVKRFFTKRNMILAVLFVVTAIYFVYNGAVLYKETINNKNKIVEIEKKIVERFPNYILYGTTGFRIIFVPSPLSVFFYNSGLFSDLNCSLDVEEQLNLNMSLKGKDLFKEKKGNYSDFAGLYYLFGTLAYLLYGFETWRNKDFIKMVASHTGVQRLRFPLLFSRFLVLTLFFMAVMVLGIIIVLVKGIMLRGTDYIVLLGYLLAWVLASGVLFWLGSIIGKLNNKTIGIVAVIITWIAMFYILPTAVKKLTYEKASSMPLNSQADLDKWNKLMNFERRAKKQEGEFKEEKARTKGGQELMESFMKEEHKEMMAMEQNLEKSKRENIHFQQWISALFPLTFLNSVSSEASSKGQESAADFFQYSWQTKNDFCHFYKNKRFYEEDEEVQSFIQNDENVFYSVSRLPAVYWVGIAILALYLLILNLVSQQLFKHYIFYLDPDDIKKLNQSLNQPAKESDEEGKHRARIHFNQGEYDVKQTGGEPGKDMAYDLLAGENKRLKKQGFSGSVWVEGEDIAARQCQYSFTYSCASAALPGDITSDTLFRFFARLGNISRELAANIMVQYDLKELTGKRINDLENHEKYYLQMAISAVKTSDIYLFYETVTGLTADFACQFKKQLQALAGNGARVLYLSTNTHHSPYKDHEKALNNTYKWGESIEHSNSLINKKKEDKS
jgi:ABC-type transport system involved in cytochrome c biogenesis ATPase subunit